MVVKVNFLSHQSKTQLDQITEHKNNWLSNGSGAMKPANEQSKIHELAQLDGYKPESSGLQNETKPKVSDHKDLEIQMRLLPIGVLLSAFQGRAAILIPRASVAIQPREGGRVVSFNTRSGDLVQKGQVLATLEFPELETELRDKRDRLADLKKQDRQIGSVQTNRSQLNISTVEQKQAANLRQIESLKVQLASNQSQREQYLDHLKYLKNFRNSTSQRLTAYNKLAAEGAVAKLDIPSYLFEFNRQEVANSINRTNVELERLNGADDSLRAQMQTLIAQNEALSTEKRQVDLQDTVSDVTRYNSIADQQRDINTLEARIRANSQVVSLYNGKLTELAVNLGEVIAPGGRIGTLEVSNPAVKANVIALFKVGDAKRITPKIKVEVIPDLYERERYGGMIAKVIEVAPQPVTEGELSSLVGSKELATKLLLGRDKDDRDKPMPTNSSVTKVMLELQTDPNTPSGYKWTEAKGAPLSITDGTTSDVYAVVERRSLLSYLTPAFRWMTGVYHN